MTNTESRMTGLRFFTAEYPPYGRIRESLLFFTKAKEERA